MERHALVTIDLKMEEDWEIMNMQWHLQSQQVYICPVIMFLKKRERGCDHLRASSTGKNVCEKYLRIKPLLAQKEMSMPFQT